MKDSAVDRRSFLGGIATAGAGVAVAGTGVAPAKAAAAAAPPKLGPPSAQLIAAETSAPAAGPPDRWHVQNPGSDYMQSHLKALGY
jgi:hypothetical protein